MKIIKYLPIAMMLVGTAVTTGCSSDFLNAENRSAGGQTDEDYFKNNPSSLLYTTYDGLKSIVTTVNIYEQGTDLYVMSQGKVASDFAYYTVNAQDGDCESLYKNCFSTINFANGVLKYAGEDSKIGPEARFIRAYCYYVLSQQFGGVPIIKEYIQSSKTDYPRESVNNVYGFIISDMTAVYNNCKLANNMLSDTQVGHATKQAVAALLAKTCLAAGWDLETTFTNVEQGQYSVNGTGYFAQAESWATNAISLSGTADGTLPQTFDDNWKQDKEDTNKETIFSVQYSLENVVGDATQVGHSLQNNFGGYYGTTSSSMIKNSGAANSQSVKSMYLWEKGDQRYDVTYMTTVYNAHPGTWGTEGYYGYYNNANPNNLDIFVKHFPWYTTLDEAKKYMQDNAARFQKGSNLNNNPRAYILTSPNVTVLTVNASGTVTTTEQTVDAFNNRADGGSIVVKKFDDKNSQMVDSKNDFRDIVLFHLADMYLVRAEARLMQSNTSGFFTDVNTVRTRAGVASITDISQYDAPYLHVYSSQTVNNLDLLLDERAREFYAENQRWMDLRRTKQLVRYNVAYNKFIEGQAARMKPNGQYKLLRPIPQNAFNYNSGMSAATDQNPGY